MIRIEIKGLPVSTNNLYVGVGRSRKLSPEAREWKRNIVAYVKCLRLEKIDGPVSVVLFFTSPHWFTKARKVRKVDLANFEKIFVDSIFEALGMRDENIFTMCLQKVEATQERSVIEIRSMPTF